MKLQAVRTLFEIEGLPFRWRREPKVDGAEAILRPVGAGKPVAPGVIIVIPDVHLGAGNDIFRNGNDAHAARLLQFLGVLKALQDSVGPALFAAIQLGDWYDFFRVPPGLDFERARSAIENAYPAIVEAARALPLLHCIGNHDFSFFKNDVPRDEIDLAIARLVGDRVLCFHGHDLVTLRDIVVHPGGERALLRVADVLASAPLIGPGVNLIQQLIDGSSHVDPFFAETVSKGWERGPEGPNDWTAPWVRRDDADQLGSVLLSYEQANGMQVRAAIVGHTHRPGIDWTVVETGRGVPVIDVGSWTYGRAEFAVIAEDGVGLATLA